MNTIFQVMTLAWSLQGGAMPNVNMADSIDSVVNYGPVLFAEYGFELSYPIFSGIKDDDSGIYTGVWIRNEFVRSSGLIYMTPIQDTYGFSLGVRWNELTVGYEHICTHPIESMIKGIVSQRIFGAVDKAFVRLSGKI